MDYEIVIATRNRPDYLTATLEDLTRQTRRPVRVVVVDASEDDSTKRACGGACIPVLYVRATLASAAGQRNKGAEPVETPLIGFLDDDVRLPDSLFEKILQVFDNDADRSVGGVAGCIQGMWHPRPRKALWLYYRLQAGFSHPDYGGRLLGPALNCLPAEGSKGLVESDWLNSGCTIYRRELFMAQLFPDFKGYSYLEDVHLSARISKTHKLYFHADAVYEHLDAPSDQKRDRFVLAKMRIRNQRRVATEAMGIKPFEWTWKIALHRCFVTGYLVVRRPEQWMRELAGLWLG
jgi:GT2 family glycosyltransferase